MDDIKTQAAQSGTITSEARENDGLKGDAGSVFRDLADAQSEFAPVVFNRVNPAFHNRYADLAAILAAVRPALNRHGLFLSQRITSDGASVQVETMLMHKSGETISSGVLSIPVENRGNRAQAFGSARTYACRYSLSSFLGVAADDDDDGNACAEPVAKAPAKPRPAPKAAKPTHAPAPAPVPAAKPEASKPSDELVKNSRAAAMNGMATYKSYFSGLKKEEQKALVDSGAHAENKETAEQADTSYAAGFDDEAPV